MVYKGISRTTILRLVIFFLTSLLFSYVVFVSHNYWISGVLLTIICIEGWDFVHFMNRINRKLAYFFGSIKNEDTSLILPENTNDKSVNKLHSVLNKVNAQIKQIKVKNENNELFFRELIEHSGTGLMSVDEKGYIVVMNEAAKEYLGIVQMANISLLKQKNKKVYDVLTGMPAGKTASVKAVGLSGVVQLMIKASHLKFGTNSYRMYVIQDVRQELEANELDSWQKLIRVLTHEIMNSIAPITSLTDTLARIYKQDQQIVSPEALSTTDIENTVRGLKVIEDGGNGLMRFVEQYRKLVRIPDPLIEKIDLEEWLAAIRLLFEKQLLDRNIELSLKKELSVQYMHADPKLLNQVMVNLMFNSMDALAQCDTRKIEIKAYMTRNDIIAISISDNGKGIDADVLDKVFIPFYTTKKKGNGIGLSLSRQIMKAHNGRLILNSVANQGTEVIMEF